MTLGDLVWDNMPLFEEYRESVKNTGAVFFQCIGNHDFDKQYQDLHNMEAGTPVYGEMVYGSYFGPTDYSFNIGKAHIVTMKDINYVGGKNYVESLTGQHERHQLCGREELRGKPYGAAIGMVEERFKLRSERKSGHLKSACAGMEQGFAGRKCP